jgi:hypothetical protein
VLADQALPEGSPLRRWFDFGAALGEFHLQVRDFDVDATGRPDRLPDIRPLVRRAQWLPGAHVLRIPALRLMVGLAPDLDRYGQMKFLLGLNMIAFALDDHVTGSLGRLRSELAPPDLTPPAVASSAVALSEPPEPTLEATSAEPPDTSPDGRESAAPVSCSTRPRWDKSRRRGRLWVGDRVVREVAHQAKNIISILDEFEKSGWVEAIPDPLTHGDKSERLGQAGPERPKQPDPERLRQAVNSLNDGIERIRFGTAFDGKGVYWEYTKRPRTS